MTFLALHWLWLFAAVAALAALYVASQFRRREYAVRFTNLALLDTVAPERPRWRRHLPAAALLLALSSLVVALARPARIERVPRERATIVVAIDTSLSMMAEDVAPNRLDAAKEAAESFVDLLPDKINVGLVSFNRTATVLVSPTDDHESIKRAIGGLQLDQGTAIGEAIFASIQAIDSLPLADDAEEPAPGRIILMSDGETTAGRPDELAAEAAIERDIPISTIAFGTASGSIVVPGEDRRISVPVNEDALRAIAQQTDGTFFTAATGEQLKDVYADIGSSVGYEDARREVGGWFVLGAVGALFVAAALSLLWFSRLP
ncbi:MAG: VWA domain-containing protein [Acidimicrobiales bacterium]|nr:VWA domain-containing protein [Acidimicrobiales bacterium]